MRLSEKISILRTEAKLTQKQLAKRVHISRQVVSKWESGQAIPTIEKLQQFSDLFHVSLDELIKQEESSLLFDLGEPSLRQQKEERGKQQANIKNKYIFGSCFCIGLLLTIGQLFYWFVVRKQGVVYLFVWMFPFFNVLLALCMLGSLLTIRLSKKLRYFLQTIWN